MTLKIYNLNNPITGVKETVYMYPESLTSPNYRFSGATVVTREPLKIPLMLIPNEYLEETQGWELTDNQYMNLEIFTFHSDDTKVKAKQAAFDDKMERIKATFGLGVAHQQVCKTIFFTGPKAVYKKPLDNNVLFQNGRLEIENIGFFTQIDSCAVKGMGEIFIAGTFDCNGDVQAESQCKIVATRK